MWRSGGIRPDALSRQLPPSRPLFRGPLRLLLIMAIVFAIFVFLSPIVFEPRVEPPTKMELGSPSSMQVHIANQNVTPLTDIEYSCEVSKLTLASGTEVTDAKVLVRGTIRRLPGRQAIAEPCETAYVLNTPVGSAEYKVTLTYRMYPWRQFRTSVYRIAAQIAPNGRVTGWKLN